MAPFFRKATGRTCRHDDCPRRGEPLDLSETLCRQCGHPLLDLMAPNRFRQSLAVLVTSGVGVLAGSGIEAVLELVTPRAGTAQGAVAAPLSTERL